jgi:predicted transcriptional regulator
MAEGARKRARRKKGTGAEGAEATGSPPPMVLVAFRVPPALAERLDRLAAALSTPWHEMKRSEVARVAVERGLEALEQGAEERGRGE